MLEKKQGGKMVKKEEEEEEEGNLLCIPLCFHFKIFKTDILSNT